MNAQQITAVVTHLRQIIVTNWEEMKQIIASCETARKHGSHDIDYDVLLSSGYCSSGKANARLRRFIGRLEAQLLLVAPINKCLLEAAILGDTRSLLGGPLNEANIYTADTEGNTALHLAVIHNQATFVCCILCNKLSVNVLNQAKESPLHLAACRGYTGLLRILLHWDADSTLRDKDGRTPVDLARLGDHRECVTILGGDQGEPRQDKIAVKPDPVVLHGPVPRPTGALLNEAEQLWY